MNLNIISNNLPVGQLVNFSGSKYFINNQQRVDFHCNCQIVIQIRSLEKWSTYSNVLDISIHLSMDMGQSQCSTFCFPINNFSHYVWLWNQTHQFGRVRQHISDINTKSLKGPYVSLPSYEKAQKKNLLHSFFLLI